VDKPIIKAAQNTPALFRNFPSVCNREVSIIASYFLRLLQISLHVLSKNRVNYHISRSPDFILLLTVRSYSSLLNHASELQFLTAHVTAPLSSRSRLRMLDARLLVKTIDAAISNSLGNFPRLVFSPA